MSPPEVWGPPVWTFLHVVTSKIKVDNYDVIAPLWLSFIKRIFQFLPCPECSRDASKQMMNITVSKLITKEDFIMCLYSFHNWVNYKKKKPVFSFDEINKYEEYNLVQTILQFYMYYNVKGNMNQITESYHRARVINDLQSFFNQYAYAFNK